MTEREIERRRDEVIKRMLATPPQPRLSPKKQKASASASDKAGKPRT